MDDDPEEAFLFNETLKDTRLQIEFTSVRNSGELISFLQTHPRPDIIFLDINMPYQDGIETLAKIKSDTHFSSIPVVIYSTSKSKVSINASYEGNAELYFVKPLDVEETVQQLKYIITINWKNYKRGSRQDFVITGARK